MVHPAMPSAAASWVQCRDTGEAFPRGLSAKVALTKSRSRSETPWRGAARGGPSCAGLGRQRASRRVPRGVCAGWAGSARRRPLDERVEDALLPGLLEIDGELVAFDRGDPAVA